jgi:hypothetical protein
VVDELAGISARPNGPQVLSGTGASMSLALQCAARMADMSGKGEKRSELINKLSSETIEGV